jgi:hypothetical protein
MSALTLSILYHAVLGLLLAAVVWTVGGGWLIALRRWRPPLEQRDAVFAYPLGLLAVLCACALFLVQRWLGLLGAALVVAPLVVAAGRHALIAPIARRAAAVVAWATPAIVGLAATVGFFLHGPTATVNSNAFGDVVWYVAKLESARRSLFPLHDLAAAGVDLWRAEVAPSLVGATASSVPGFDPFLFHTSLLPAFLGASLCCGFAILPESGRVPRIPLALLAVGMSAYPSWLAESPPVTLALPLAFAIFELVERPVPKRLFASVLAVVALDLVLTKGLVLVPLAILAAFALRRYRWTARERRTIAVGVPLAVAGLIAATLANSWWVLKAASVHFEPLTAYHGLRSQLRTRSTIKLAPTLQLAGYLALGLVLLRARATALLVALAVSLVWSWTIFEYSIEIGLGTVVLLSVLLVRRRPPPAPLDGLLVMGAGTALALGCWFRDFAGVRAAYVESACLAAVALSALASSPKPGRRGLLSLHLRLYALVGGTALLALSGHALVGGLALLASLGAYALARKRLPATPRLASLVAAVLLAGGGAAAVAAGRADDLRLGSYDTTILTHEHYDVWHRAGELVPANGLVFTDETGPEVQAQTGQNYYPAIAGRQVYLAGWYQSRLREDDRDREQRLRLNSLVLSGTITPWRAVGAHRYGSFYAVIDRARLPDPSFRRLYANARFALYRIVGPTGSGLRRGDSDRPADPALSSVP